METSGTNGGPDVSHEDWGSGQPAGGGHGSPRTAGATAGVRRQEGDAGSAEPAVLGGGAHWGTRRPCGDAVVRRRRRTRRSRRSSRRRPG